MRLRKQNIAQHVMQNQVWSYAVVMQCYIYMKALHVMESWHDPNLHVVVVRVINNLAIPAQLAIWTGCGTLEMYINYLKRYKQGQLSQGGKTHDPPHKSLSTGCSLLCQSCTYLHCHASTFSQDRTEDNPKQSLVRFCSMQTCNTQS